MENDNNLTSNCQDLKRLGTIYLIINLINGKKYVGQTRRSLEERINEHRRCKNDIGVDLAIQKYGWENFKVEIIEVCPVDKLNEREIFWIAELNTKVPNGYNLTEGGDGGINPSAETRAKISVSKKGKSLSKEHRAKISANHADMKGENNPFYGKHHTEESKAKISANLPDMKGANNPFYGKHHTAESRAKISANHADVKGEKNPNYGKHLTDEQKKHLSDINTGENNPNYGKHRSEETKAKMSESQKAYWAKKKAEKNLENQND